MITLLDNTVLSNFSTIERPDLVHLVLADTAATVLEVQYELATGFRLGKYPVCDWSWLRVLQLDKGAQPLYQQLRSRLDAGEAACLALAATQGYRVFTDDRDARKIAIQMGIPISGTLGLLVLTIDKEILSLAEADDLLRRMIAAGYRSPITTLAEVL